MAYAKGRSLSSTPPPPSIVYYAPDSTTALPWILGELLRKEGMVRTYGSQFYARCGGITQGEDRVKLWSRVLRRAYGLRKEKKVGRSYYAVRGLVGVSYGARVGTPVSSGGTISWCVGDMSKN